MAESCVSFLLKSHLLITALFGLQKGWEWETVFFLDPASFFIIDNFPVAYLSPSLS